MWFFKKKEEKTDEIWNKLTKLLEIIQIEITKLDGEVQTLKLQLSNRLTKKKLKENQENQENQEEFRKNNTIDDGFNELRRLNKEFINPHSF